MIFGFAPLHYYANAIKMIEQQLKRQRVHVPNSSGGGGRRHYFCKRSFALILRPKRSAHNASETKKRRITLRWAQAWEWLWKCVARVSTPTMLNARAQCHTPYYAASDDERKCDYSLPFQFGIVRAVSISNRLVAVAQAHISDCFQTQRADCWAQPRKPLRIAKHALHLFVARHVHRRRHITAPTRAAAIVVYPNNLCRRRA